MRKLLGLGGFAIFVGAISLGLWLLFAGKLSGAEFVAFVIAFSIFGAVVSFAPEVQEFSVAGNLVKLREVKNDALQSIALLKQTQAELLLLVLRARVSFVNESKIYDPKHQAIDQDFWNILAEARRIGALPKISGDVLKAIDSIIPALYQSCIRWGGDWTHRSPEYETFADAVKDLLNAEKMSAASKAFKEDDETLFSDYVRARLSEMESIFTLKKELTALRSAQ